MGGSQSSDGGGLLAGCQRGSGTRAPGAPIVLSVVRTTDWGLGPEEDVWQVEVAAAATVADLKAKIEELYDVPVHAQLLRQAGGPGAGEGPSLEDTVAVETLPSRLYLYPTPMSMGLGAGLGGESSPEEEAAMAGMAEALMGAVQEAEEVDQALMESLQGVTYKVTFERPQEAGGQAAGKKVRLDLDALALVGDVQQMVEVEMFGEVGKEPAFLVFEGRLMPPPAPLFHVGIEDGKTVVVAKERPPPTEEDMLMAGLMDGPGLAALQAA